MSVVGFDFGNYKCVVSVARKRGIDVLQNEVGNRKSRLFTYLSIPLYVPIGEALNPGPMNR